MESHLLQMRGLKQLNVGNYTEASDVASFTDAWIETTRNNHLRRPPRSRIFYRCVD